MDSLKPEDTEFYPCEELTIEKLLQFSKQLKPALQIRFHGLLRSLFAQGSSLTCFLNRSETLAVFHCAKDYNYSIFTNHEELLPVVLSKLVDFDNIPNLVIASLDDDMLPRMQQLLVDQYGFSTEKLHVEPCWLWRLNQDKYHKLHDCLNNNSNNRGGGGGGEEQEWLRALQESESLVGDDAITVNDTWKYKRPGSCELIRECIETRPSACVRLLEGNATASNEQGSCATEQDTTTTTPTPKKVLASWSVLRADYSISSLYTFEQYRGQKLARRVVQALSMKLIQEGLVPHCYIVRGNTASEKCFAGLGFEQGMLCSWVVAPNHRYKNQQQQQRQQQ
eukprot:GEZU01000065.1.p1 GENE.GEZU01000065.1~~GEZU01000065.1.p1  ORF type:complete len:337 (+),score=80.76 GEZU01000065.1:75-1085(+)